MPVRPRRRPVRAVPMLDHPTPPSLSARIARAAVSPAARTAYIVLGSVGLAALAVAVVGPKRINSQVLKPIGGAVGDQAEKLWDESRGLRRLVAGLFERASTPSGREKLVRNFQSWAGHFRAT